MQEKRKGIAPVDLAKVKRYPYKRRENKTHTAAFGRPIKRLTGDDFWGNLPDFLKAKDLKAYVQAVYAARRKNKPFHLLLGAHTIKVGLSPIFVDLMKQEIVTGISINSAGLIHDLELAFFGGTSEDVQAGLRDGSFGMVQETGELFAAVCDLSYQRTIGIGEAAGKLINGSLAPNRGVSLFAVADKLGLPITVHAGIGTDIVSQHPNFDGGKLGAGSHHDFRILSAVCRDIDRGGVVANVGSAVILPEVFLKALTVARNLNGGAGSLTTANFDMIVQYRPTENVVSRPTAQAGKGYTFVGHHELMIPLLAWGLKRQFSSRGKL